MVLNFKEEFSCSIEDLDAASGEHILCHLTLSGSYYEHIRNVKKYTWRKIESTAKFDILIMIDWMKILPTDNLLIIQWDKGLIERKYIKIKEKKNKS